jgi:TolB-like protein
MKHKLLLLFRGVLMGLATSFASATAEPTTASSAAPLGVKTDPRVEVFAFSPLSNAAGQDWTGRGIQENLQSDISRTGATLVLPPHAPAPNDDPIAVARQNGADLAVVGTYQVVGNQIRANGNLISVADNKSIGGFSATGNQQDLFKIEDALGEQLRSLLPGQMTAEQIRQEFEQPQAAPIYTQPLYTQSPSYNYAYDYTAQPAVVNNYYDTAPATPYYTYPDYTGFYDYPYGLSFYSGFGYGFYNRGYGYRGHDRDRGFVNHGFVDRGLGRNGFGGTTFRGSGFSHSGGSSGFRGGFSGGFPNAIHNGTGSAPSAMPHLGSVGGPVGGGSAGGAHFGGGFHGGFGHR